MNAASLSELENRIGHVFSNKALLRDALTHSSTGAEKNYERLEFLGDRVLGLIAAERLFKSFPREPEGHLAKRLAALVEGVFLAALARKINLGAYVEFSPAERQAGGAENENILADVFEALLGALYLDAGLDKCRDVLTALWGEEFSKKTAPPQHPKTALQEWAQGQGLALPLYEIIAQEGPDHAPVFKVRLQVEGYPEITVRDRTRQLAEKKAARRFLEQLGPEKS